MQLKNLQYYSNVVISEQLELDTLPRESETRLLIELIHDSVGQPVHIPVIVARGRREGPVFGITAALHGNEVNGIPSIHRLFEQLDLRQLRGTLVGVLVLNIPSYIRQRRRFVDNVDLNRTWPGVPNGNVSQVYTNRFMERVGRHFNYLIDLHTASFGRINSLYVRADMSDPIIAQMARLQRRQIILHNPPSGRTLRGTMAKMGIPAITVEIGDPHLFQPKYINLTTRGIRRVLVHLGMLPRRAIKEGPPPILCSHSYWLYTDQGGLLTVLPDVTEKVEAKQLIARQRNIFGDLIREYHAPEAGIVIGKSTNPVGQTGARILHLGIIASPEEGAIPKSDRSEKSKCF